MLTTHSFIAAAALTFILLGVTVAATEEEKMADFIFVQCAKSVSMLIISAEGRRVRPCRRTLQIGD